MSGLNKTVDYGWFWFFAQPLLWILNILNSFVMNYGVAIILLTILLRLLMWPLTRKSYVSSIQMQRMQPEMQRIQKLYANDKARLQLEMMNLYKTHKTSPMSGCLPMLLQIPIFFALYKALLVSVNMRNAGFLWIHDLAAMDPYFILPILMGATMWLQQYLQTPKQTSNMNDIAASTQRVMKWMPALFTVLFAWNTWKFALMALGVIMDLFLGILMLPFTAFAETITPTSYKGLAGNIFNGFIKLFNAGPVKLNVQVNRFINAAIYFVSLSIVIAICAALLYGIIGSDMASQIPSLDNDGFIPALLTGSLVAYLASQADDIATKIGGSVDTSFSKQFGNDVKTYAKDAYKAAADWVKAIKDSVSS